MSTVYALTVDGKLTKCKAAPGERGRGRCNHIDHQKDDESITDFLSRIDNKIKEESESEDYNKENYISQDQIDEFASMIDKIAGTKVTSENLYEVLNTLEPEQIRQIAKIGFDAAPEFSLPISDKEYGQTDLDNKLYFASMPTLGIAGKQTSIEQMFMEVGTVPSEDGEIFISGNYKEGLSPDEYFEKQFSARAAQIAKSVSTAVPGYTARKMFYAFSDMEVKSDCGHNESSGVMECKIPGSVCAKCCSKSGLKFKQGELIGSLLSTNLSEPTTQVVMKQFHTGGKDLEAGKKRNLIFHTFDAYKTSSIIQDALSKNTTEERRQAIYEGLKKAYKDNGISVDDWHFQVVAKKLTSYKRDPKEGTRYVKDGECCDIVSLGAIGNHNNPFKAAELSTGYKNLTKPGKHSLKRDAATNIIFN